MAGVSPRRFPSPLRYPGGKGKIVNFVKLLILENELVGTDYVEPYAGGASVALSLLYEEYVGHIYINDLNSGVAAFWRAVLNDTDELCERIQTVPVSMETWHAQREVQSSADAPDIDLAFATFFLNRTNRSGILEAGVVGGQDQSGPWKLDARYSAADLCRRIRKISRFSARVTFSQMDALQFLDQIPASDRLVYLDPPYYLKGSELYTNWYEDEDHLLIAAKVARLGEPWMVSYDACPRVLDFYGEHQRLEYQLSYSAASPGRGTEWIFLSPGLSPPTVDAIAGIRVDVVDRARASWISRGRS